MHSERRTLETLASLGLKLTLLFSVVVLSGGVLGWFADGADFSVVNIVWWATPVLYVFGASSFIYRRFVRRDLAALRWRCETVSSDAQWLVDNASRLTSRVELLKSLEGRSTDQTPLSARAFLLSGQNIVRSAETLAPISEGLEGLVDAIFFWRTVSVVGGLFGTVFFFGAALVTGSTVSEAALVHVGSALLCTIAGLLGSFALGVLGQEFSAYTTEILSRSRAVLDGQVLSLLSSIVPSEPVTNEAQFWEAVRQGIARLLERTEAQQTRLATAVEQNAVALQQVYDQLSSAPPVTLPSQLSELAESISQHSALLSGSAEGLSAAANLVASSVETLGVAIPRSVVASNAAVQQALTVVSGSVEDIGAELTTLNGSMANTVGAMETLKRTIGDVEANVHVVSKSVTTNESDVAKLHAKVDELGPAVSRATSEAASASHGVASAVRQLGQHADDIKALDTKATQLDQHVVALSSAFAEWKQDHEMSSKTIVNAAQDIKESAVILDATASKATEVTSLLSSLRERSTAIERDTGAILRELKSKSRSDSAYTKPQGLSESPDVGPRLDKLSAKLEAVQLEVQTSVEELKGLIRRTFWGRLRNQLRNQLKGWTLLRSRK